MTAQDAEIRDAGIPGDKDKKPSFVEYLVGWNWQRYQVAPRHHIRIAKWLDGMWNEGRRRLLLMAFRGAGKSTVLGLFCAWLLTVRPDLRILTLSADEALARRMLRSALKIIERHRESRPVRPERPEQWSALRFSVAGSPHGRDPSMLAAGLDSNITGARADVIVCDDVEVPKTCATPALRAKLRERLSELEFVLTPGGTQLFIGTPHAWDSIYGTAHPDTAEDGIAEPERGAFLDGFERLDLPVMDDAGAPLWPEKFDPPHIETLRKRAGPVRFASQMMLQPADAEETRLDIGLIHPYEAKLKLSTANGEQILFLGGRKIRSASCWWDPALWRHGAARRQRGRLRLHRCRRPPFHSRRPLSAPRSRARRRRRGDGAMPSGSRICQAQPAYRRHGREERHRHVSARPAEQRAA